MVGVTAASATAGLGTGSHSSASAESSISLSLTISGAPKARVKVRGAGHREILRNSTVMSLPTGTYKVRAFKVKSRGTRYVPKNRRFTVRAKRARSFKVKVRYKKVAKTVTIGTATGSPRRRDAIPASPAPAGELGTLFTLVNEARSSSQRCGSKTMPPVAPVVYNDNIGRAAQKHAEDMADNSYFDHVSLDGRSFADRIEDAGYRGYPGGENIASGFSTAKDTLNGWLSSPGHCLNMMDSDFVHMGLGKALRKDTGYSVPITYWVQDFGYGS